MWNRSLPRAHFVIHDPKAGVRFERLLEQPFITIGRLLDNDLCIPFEFISRFHATLRFEKGEWSIRDLNSRFGTKLYSRADRGLYLKPFDWVALPRGSVSFSISRLNVMFSPLSASRDKPRGLFNVVPIMRPAGNDKLPPGVIEPSALPNDSENTERPSFDRPGDFHR